MQERIASPTTQPGGAAAVLPGLLTVVAGGPGWSVRDAGRPLPAEWDPLAVAGSTPRPPFAAPSPPPVSTAGSATHPAQARTPVGRLGICLGVLASVAAVVSVVALSVSNSGGVGAVFGAAPVLNRPASIGPLARIDTPAVQRLTDGLQSRYAGASVHVVSGVYGSADVPQVLFVGAQSSGATVPARQLVASIDSSASPFVGTPLTATAGGQAYVCGAVRTSAGQTASLCAWSDRGIAGYLLNAASRDLSATLRLAVAAKAAAES